MEHALTKSALSLMLAASLVGSATWSTDSHACASESLIGAVCIMATSGNWSSITGYALAQGQQMQIMQNQALFSIIGTTWGGDGKNYFNLPNLSGRVVVGAGTLNLPASGSTQFVAGKSGGAIATMLSSQQLPQHNHALIGATVDIGKMTATTTLSGLTTTTNLANVPFTSSSSSLSIKALSTNGSSATPSSSSYMAKSGLPSATVYTTSTPDTVMAPGSVVGTVSGTLSGTAPGTVSGGAATTALGGTASVSGSTDVAGSSAAVSLMQPYLVMNYYVAINGLYPPRD